MRPGWGKGVEQTKKFTKMRAVTTRSHDMSGSMKVHLYDVRRHASPPIEQMLTSIHGQQLAHRMRTIGVIDLRLEQCLPPSSGNNSSPYWLLDFTNIRFRNGPGKANRVAPMTGFNLGPQDGFGEETAALYDAQKRVLLVQYNHHGPRASGICSYVNSFDSNATHDYQLTIRINANAASRLNGKSILKKIDAKITPPKISANMRRQGVSLNKALDISDDMDGRTIEISISAGRSSNSKLNFQKARDFINSLQHLIGDGAVERLEVSGKATPDSRVETIDLIEEKIEADINNLTLGPDLRYTQSSRWEALIRARNGWNSII